MQETVSDPLVYYFVTFQSNSEIQLHWDIRAIPLEESEEADHLFAINLDDWNSHGELLP